MDIGQTFAADERHQRAVGFLGIRVGDVVEGHVRRQLDTDATGARHRDHRVERFDDEAGAMGRTAAIAIGAGIAARRQELHRQVARCRMQFDTVEARVERTPGCGRVLGNHAGDLADLQRARRHVILHAGQRIRLALGSDGGRRHRGRTVGQHRRVGDPARVHDLRDDLPTPGMHGIGHGFPARDLRVGMQPRRAEVTLAHGRWIGTLADDEACARPLRVVGGHQRAGHARHVGARARHRRHHDAIGQRDAASLKRGEQVVSHAVSCAV